MAKATSTTENTAKKAPAPAKQATPVAATPAPVKPAVAEKAPVKKAAVAKKAAKAAPAKKVAAKKAPAKKIAAKKIAAKKAPAKKPAAKKAAPKAPKPVAKKTPVKTTAKPEKTVTQLKETIMAINTTDYTAAITDTVSGAVNEMQTRAQAAYEKSTEAMTEATDFAKGNVEAVVESGKVLVEGVQGMGEGLATEAKSVYETATADLKEMASVKSPTELFQLQGKIMRRNFDAMVAATSKNTDASMKLANDVIAPISGRVNVAAEKLSNVA